MMTIRETTSEDFDAIMDIHYAAFAQADEGELSLNLLEDPAAQPVLSLLFSDAGKPCGHILFSRCELVGLDVYLLAPLAVKPDFQKKGVGRQLIEAGLSHLREIGVDLVFVLGHPDYYPKFGFQTDAAAYGYRPPHPIAEVYRDAWMVQALKEGVLGSHCGTLKVADAIAPFEYWSD